MKLDGPQSLPISVLKGALVTNPNGAEFYITGVSVDIANHEIYIQLEFRTPDASSPNYLKTVDGGSVEWSTLKDWSIQFQGGT